MREKEEREEESSEEIEFKELLPSTYFNLDETKHSSLFTSKQAPVWLALSLLPSYLSSIISSVGDPSSRFPNMEIWPKSDYASRVHPSVVVESPDLVAIGRNVKIGPCVLIQGTSSLKQHFLFSLNVFSSS